MRRLFAFWGVLAIAMPLATIGSSFLLFRHVDLTFEAFGALVVIPPFQALVLTWATAPPYRDPPRRVWTYLTTPMLALPVLCIDGALLPFGWLLWDWPLVGLTGASSLQAPWFAIKALMAGAWLLWSGSAGDVHRVGGPQDSHHDGQARGRGGRGGGWLLLFGMWLLAIGLHPWFAWLPFIESTLTGAHALGQPEVLARLELGVVLPVAFFLVALKAGAVLVRRVPPLERAWDTALALCVIGTLSVVLNTFLYGALLEPYRSVWLTSASAATTLFLLCSFQGVRRA